MENRKTFNKLVRDKIADIIKQKGGSPEIEILDDAAFKKSLNEKLLEECQEVINASDTQSKAEELADLLEVIHAISGVLKVPFNEIENVRLKKREKRGGFDSRIFLKSTSMVENFN